MKSRDEAMLKVAAAHDELDGVEATLAPHATLAEAMVQSGYPQSQVDGARLADMVAAFRGVVTAIRHLLPSREEMAASAAAEAEYRAPAPQAPAAEQPADPRVEGFKVVEPAPQAQPAEQAAPAPGLGLGGETGATGPAA